MVNSRDGSKKASQPFEEINKMRAAVFYPNPDYTINQCKNNPSGCTQNQKSFLVCYFLLKP